MKNEAFALVVWLGVMTGSCMSQGFINFTSDLPHDLIPRNQCLTVFLIGLVGVFVSLFFMVYEIKKKDSK